MVHWDTVLDRILANTISFACILGIATLVTIHTEHTFTLNGSRLAKYALVYRYGGSKL